MGQERYAIFIRVSTEKQATEGDSLEMQVNLAMDIIKKNNGVHYKTYEEGGISATKTDISERYELIEAFNDAKKGLFDVLIVYARDRLYRKVVDKHIVFSWLKESGIDIVFSQTGERFVFNPDDPEQEFMEDLKASLGRLESAKTRVRVKSTRLDKSKRGEDVGGNLPYGYERTNEGIVPVEDEIPIIQEIEEMYLSGYGIHSICKWLNGEEVKNLGFREGGRVSKRKQFARSTEYWTKDIVKTILFNPFYAGYFEYSTDGDKKLVKDDSLIKVVKGQHEPIRSEERFKTINAMRNKKNSETKAPNFYNTTFLFTGLLFCKECGKKYISANSTKPNGVRYSYYYCSSRANHMGLDACDNRNYKKETLEAFIIDQLKDYLKNIPYDRLKQNVMDKLDTKNKQVEQDLQNVRNEINRLERGKESIIKAIMSLDITKPTYEQMKNIYEEQLEKIIIELADNKTILNDLENQISMQEDNTLLRDAVINKMRNFSRIYETSPAHLRKALLDEIVESIYIDKDGRIKITLSMDLKTSANSVEIMTVGNKEEFIKYGVVSELTPPNIINITLDIPNDLTIDYVSWTKQEYYKAKNSFRDWLIDITKPYRRTGTRNPHNPQIIADKSGVSYYSIKSYLYHGCLPNVENISKIASAFNSSVEEFFKYAEVESDKESFQMIIDNVMRWEKDESLKEA